MGKPQARGRALGQTRRVGSRLLTSKLLVTPLHYPVPLASIAEACPTPAETPQFTSGEDDTFDILNESLDNPNIGQTGLDDQMEFGMGRDMFGGLYEGTRSGGAVYETENGVPLVREYDFGECCGLQLGRFCGTILVAHLLIIGRLASSFDLGSSAAE
jgi:hypothetical protein